MYMNLLQWLFPLYKNQIIMKKRCTLFIVFGLNNYFKGHFPQKYTFDNAPYYMLNNNNLNIVKLNQISRFTRKHAFNWNLKRKYYI